MSIHILGTYNVNWIRVSDHNTVYPTKFTLFELYWETCHVLASDARLHFNRKCCFFYKVNHNFMCVYINLKYFEEFLNVFFSFRKLDLV